MAILLTFVPPGQHQQAAENMIGYSDNRKIAVLADLPFVLPATHDFRVDNWVADIANSLPNSKSRPFTPDIIVLGARRPDHYMFPGLKFGATCIVQEFKAKRAVEAKASDIPVSNIHVAELGV